MATPNQPSDIGGMLFAKGINDGANTHTNSGAGFPSSGGKNGGIGGNIDENLKILGGADGINLATGSLDGILSIFKGNGGVFENGEIFAFADALALGKISYPEFLEMAKKNLLKIGDLSAIEETGFKLGAALSPISSGQGQEH
jgi:hypothetical protein